jgi:hypothetical protein
MCDSHASPPLPQFPSQQPQHVTSSGRTVRPTGAAGGYEEVAHGGGAGGHAQRAAAKDARASFRPQQAAHAADDSNKKGCSSTYRGVRQRPWGRCALSAAMRCSPRGAPASRLTPPRRAAGPPRSATPTAARACGSAPSTPQARGYGGCAARGCARCSRVLGALTSPHVVQRRLRARMTPPRAPSAGPTRAPTSPTTRHSRSRCALPAAFCATRHPC